MLVGPGGRVSFDPSVTSVTVTATLRSPNINGWSALSGGWVVVADDATKATLTVELTPGTCEATQPAVTAVPPQCVAGTVTLGTVTPVAVAGVTYDPAGVTTVALGAAGDGDGDVGCCGCRLGGAVDRWVGRGRLDDGDVYDDCRRCLLIRVCGSRRWRRW